MSDINSRDTFVNTFERGLNVDVADKFKDNNVYKEAFNLQLFGGVLRNMKGSGTATTQTETSVTGYHVMGSFRVNALINNSGVYTYEQVFVVFVTTTQTGPIYYFRIYMFRPAGPAFYKLYESVVTADYYSALVDGVVSADGGIDTLYFTSSVFEPRRLRCYFVLAAPTKTLRELELFRRMPGNNIAVSNIIYIPKPVVGIVDTHTIDIEVASVDYNTATHKQTTYNIILTPDSEAGDEFTFTIHHLIAVSQQGDEETRYRAKIDIQEWGGASYASRAGFPKEIWPAASASYYEETTIADEIVSISGAYEGANPMLIILDVERTHGTGSYWAKSEANITSIAEVAGGDVYYLGANVYKSLQVP